MSNRLFTPWTSTPTEIIHSFPTVSSNSSNSSSGSRRRSSSSSNIMRQLLDWLSVDFNSIVRQTLYTMDQYTYRGHTLLPSVSSSSNSSNSSSSSSGGNIIGQLRKTGCPWTSTVLSNRLFTPWTSTPTEITHSFPSASRSSSSSTSSSSSSSSSSSRNSNGSGNIIGQLLKDWTSTVLSNTLYIMDSTPTKTTHRFPTVA